MITKTWTGISQDGLGILTVARAKGPDKAYEQRKAEMGLYINIPLLYLAPVNHTKAAALVSKPRWDLLLLVKEHLKCDNHC